MGKIKQKTLEKRNPNQARYISRTRALRKVQVSLKTFRSLCILKGIYPRIPRRKTDGKGKLYYLHKDIKFLLHDPMVARFREFKTYKKKLARAEGRRDTERVWRLKEAEPEFTLDHLIRERYPTFDAAVHDLDDALSMVYLMREVKSSSKTITEEVRLQCEVLAAQWDLYVVLTRALRKGFISVRGFYFQAAIEGADVTWLVPHNFRQETPKFVDFSVMRNFLDFHRTLLTFVMYRLYTSIGVAYPPSLDYDLVAKGDILSAFMLGSSTTPVLNEKGAIFAKVERDLIEAAEGDSNASEASKFSVEIKKELRHEVDGEEPEGEEEEEDDEDEAGEVIEEDIHEDDVLNDSDEDSDEEEEDSGDDDSDDEKELTMEEKLMKLQGKVKKEKGAGSEDAVIEVKKEDAPLTKEEAQFRESLLSNQRQVQKLQTLFEGCHFWISREAPRGVFQFLALALGADVSYAGCPSGVKEGSPLITHEVVDRSVQKHRYLTRAYVQPQWLFDSLNFSFRLPLGEYLPGAELPDHLSPFVKDEELGYIPQRKTEVLQMIRAATADGPAAPREDEAPDLTDYQKRRQQEEEFSAELRAEMEGEAPTAAVEAVAEAYRKKRERIDPLALRSQKNRQEEAEERRAAALLSAKKRRRYNSVKKMQKEREARNMRLEKRRRVLQKQKPKKEWNKK